MYCIQYCVYISALITVIILKCNILLNVHFACNIVITKQIKINIVRTLFYRLSINGCQRIEKKHTG